MATGFRLVVASVAILRLTHVHSLRCTKTKKSLQRRLANTCAMKGCSKTASHVVKTRDCFHSIAAGMPCPRNWFRLSPLAPNLVNNPSNPILPDASPLLWQRLCRVRGNERSRLITQLESLASLIRGAANSFSAVPCSSRVISL